jgi:hypothetical protein
VPDPEAEAVVGWLLDTALLRRAGRSRMLVSRSTLCERRRASRRAFRTGLVDSFDLRYLSAKAAARDSNAGKAWLRVADSAVREGSSVARLDREVAEAVIDLCERLARACMERRSDCEDCAKEVDSAEVSSSREREVSRLI